MTIIRLFKFAEVQLFVFHGTRKMSKTSVKKLITTQCHIWSLPACHPFISAFKRLFQVSSSWFAYLSSCVVVVPSIEEPINMFPMLTLVAVITVFYLNRQSSRRTLIDLVVMVCQILIS